MKINLKNTAFLFFLIMDQSAMLLGSKQVNNSKKTNQAAAAKKSSVSSSKASSAVSSVDIENLINKFVTIVNTIDSKNEKTFNTLTQRAYKLLSQIKTFIAQNPDKISKEQLDTINSAVKKMPKQTEDTNKDLEKIVASLQEAATKNPENMQADIKKAQQLIVKLQEMVKANPNLATSQEQKEAIEKALQKLPKRSEKLDKLLEQFKAAIEKIPAQGSTNFNEMVMNAVVADQQLLNFLKKEKPIVTKDQGESINSLVKEFKTKLPTMKSASKNK